MKEILKRLLDYLGLALAAGIGGAVGIYVMMEVLIK